MPERKPRAERKELPVRERKSNCQTRAENDKKELIKLPGEDWLKDCVKILQQSIGDQAVEKYYINPLSKNVPTLEVDRKFYWKVAERLKNDERLSFDYLVELHGTDFETYIGLYLYLYSMKYSKEMVVKTNLERAQPVAPSVTNIWPGANWPECEAYDLLGIRFEGHPNLHRIFLGEGWKGYPLRKDYVDENTDFL